MAAKSSKDLILVGSIPLDVEEQVFQWLCDGGLAGELSMLPDGETGERSYWIIMLAYRVFHGHPDIETVARPAPIDGRENWRPKNLRDSWQFKMKSGVSELRFGDQGWRLGYARDAIRSYLVFRHFRDKGLVAPDARFQVCLPMIYSAFGAVFTDPTDWQLVAPAIEEAMSAELDTILDRIPHRDLAIQWDCAVEVSHLDGGLPWAPLDGALERITAPVPRLSARIPKEVALGYHLCYGTLGGWPMSRPDDLGNLIEYTNTVVARSGRPVDFLHIPILGHTSDSYFRPLGDLDARGASIYLGVIHNMKDMDDFRRRISESRKYISEFGVGAPCGFGRDPDLLPRILDEHLTALKVLRQG